MGPSKDENNHNMNVESSTGWYNDAIIQIQNGDIMFLHSY